jgi:hypothetical protein
MSFVSMTINGKRINVPGRNLTINGDKIIVDGKQVDLDGFGNDKVFNIVVEGNVDKVDGDFASIEVVGDAGSVKTMSGDATVRGDVTGSVSTMSGDVRVKGAIGGNVSTMSGDIKK